MKNIAVLCSGISVSMMRDNFTGIRECARANNCNVFFFSCEKTFVTMATRDLGEFNIYNAANFGDFDGAIVMNNTIMVEEVMHSIEDRIVEANIPAVTIEGPNPHMYNIRIENRAAMREMVRHFIEEHRFTHINFVSGPLENPEARAREKGYRDALEQYGIPIVEERIFEGSFMPASGRDAAAYFLEHEEELPEAIVCSNDFMAFGVHQYLEKKGIQVPEQVAISGFDDMAQARYYEPRLTSVSRENYKAGYAACMKLIEGISPEEVGTDKILQTNVVVRESCGCVCREEIDNAAFRKNHYAGIDKEETYSTDTRRMAIELNRAESLDDIRNVLMKYIKTIQCDECYICLSNEWEGIHASDSTANKYGLFEIKDDYIREGYGSGTFLLCGYSSHSFKDMASFSITTLLNALKEQNSGRNNYIVVPLHFMDRSFGYVIISNCDFAFEQQLFQFWIMSISSALENVRKLNLQNAMIKKLDSLWVYDNLTGIYNRSGFDKYGTMIWEDCIRNNENAALFFIDLDGLKKVNDVFGHDAGDRFIKAVSSILKKHKRHGEAIMRFGGDEFVVLVPGINEAEAKDYKEAIQNEMVYFNKMRNLPFSISVSVGYCFTKPQEGMDLEEAIMEADTQMYAEKHAKGVTKPESN